MYSRLRFGVYGQLIVTRVPIMGSRKADWPVMTIALSVMLTVLLPMPGRPPVGWPELTETQVCGLARTGQEVSMIQVRPAKQRGRARFGWLDSHRRVAEFQRCGRRCREATADGDER